MDQTSATRQHVRTYVERLEARDWHAFAGLLDKHVVYEMPQTRERVRGKAAYLRFNQEYPDGWHLTLRRLVADGPFAAAWIDATMHGEPQTACVWFELSDEGRITHITDYWPETYTPPAGREHLVERW